MIYQQNDTKTTRVKQICKFGNPKNYLPLGYIIENKKLAFGLNIRTQLGMN